MDTIEVVDKVRQRQIDEAQTWLTELKKVGFPIHAAFWAKRPDDERWRLYLATPALERIGINEAIGQVLQAIRSLGNYSPRDSSAIRLVDVSDAFVEDILTFQKQFPELTRQELRSQRFAGKTFDVYIYPLGEISIPIYGEAVHLPNGRWPLCLLFEEFALPMWVEVGNAGEKYPVEKGYKWVVAAPEGATLERDEYGRLFLKWNFRGMPKESDANEVMALADLGLHGFRTISEPAKLKKAAPGN